MCCISYILWPVLNPFVGWAAWGGHCSENRPCHFIIGAAWILGVNACAAIICWGWAGLQTQAKISWGQILISSVKITGVYISFVKEQKSLMWKGSVPSPAGEISWKNGSWLNNATRNSLNRFTPSSGTAYTRWGCIIKFDKRETHRGSNISAPKDKALLSKHFVSHKRFGERLLLLELWPEDQWPAVTAAAGSCLESCWGFCGFLVLWWSPAGEDHYPCLSFFCLLTQKAGKQETTATRHVSRKSEANFNRLKAATE